MTGNMYSLSSSIPLLWFLTFLSRLSSCAPFSVLGMVCGADGKTGRWFCSDGNSIGQWGWDSCMRSSYLHISNDFVHHCKVSCSRAYNHFLATASQGVSLPEGSTVTSPTQASQYSFRQPTLTHIGSVCLSLCTVFIISPHAAISLTN